MPPYEACNLHVDSLGNYCANWTIVNNKLLCKPTVLHTSEPKKNKLNRQPKRLMLFIMVNSVKNYSH